MTSDTLTNVDIVVYALADLGGGAREFHLEEIAHHAWELAPDRFSWSLSKFKSYPDKDLVRVTLTDARKPKYGCLVKGSRPVKGSKVDASWTLTVAGTRWFAVRQEQIAGQLSRPKTSGVRHREVQAVVGRIRKHVLFQEYVNHGDTELQLTPAEFADFLGCSPDASPRVMGRKLLAYENAAAADGDREIGQLLEYLRVRFSNMLGEGVQ